LTRPLLLTIPAESATASSLKLKVCHLKHFSETMIQPLEVATVFAFCCLLNVGVTFGQHPGTKFTQEPPGKVFGNLGYDVSFHWKFAFGDDQDWADFEEIFWGRTDNNDKIRNKYIAVGKNGKISYNRRLAPSLQSQLAVTGNVSRRGCDLVFVLNNVSSSDELTTYGCTAIVYGDAFRSGPITLVIQVPPKITTRSNATIDVEEGDDVNLQCNASGDPPPYIKWTKDGILLQSSNKTTGLHIPSIELKQAGTYVCTAVNHAGSVSYNVLVRVLRSVPSTSTTTTTLKPPKPSRPVAPSRGSHVVTCVGLVLVLFLYSGKTGKIIFSLRKNYL